MIRDGGLSGQTTTDVIAMLCHKLWQTPLLLGWLIVGLALALLLHGAWRLVEGMINLALLGFWVLLIRQLTPLPPNRRRCAARGWNAGWLWA